MSLAATFRVLYSGDASFERKLEAAEKLVAALLADGGPTEPLPPLVRGHYLRSLVEWSTGALTKDGGGGKGSKKRKQQQKGQEQEAGGGGGGAPHGAHPARLEPRCWAVLVAVLGSGANAPGQPLPAALLPAATATMQLAEGGALGGEQRAQEELLAQVAALLRLLNRKFAAGFRPSIEHAVGAAEAALSGHAAAAAEGFAAWAPAATAAAQLLLAAAGGHPSPRKVWDAAVPRLLPPLAQAGFAAEPGTHAAELASCCRQVLEAVLLSQQHVAALAAAAAAEMAAAVAEASSADGAAAEAAAQAAAEGMQVDGEKEEGGGTAAAGSGSQSKKQQQGYATQLFSALRAQVAAGDVPLAALPWLAGRFCTALKQHRRAAETEVDLTRHAGHHSQQQQADGQAGEEGTSGGRSAARDGGSTSVSADFHFWLALLRTLLPRVQELQAQGPAAAAQLAASVSGTAQLAAALRAHRLYRPTQDPAGHQRLLLQRLADAALQLAQQGQQQEQGGAGAAAVVTAALGVLQGILSVEHRVIQQQLPLLWPLLLSRPAVAGGSGDGDDVAVAVACSLVDAFAELRQLEAMLASLTEALLQPSTWAPASAAPGGAAPIVQSGRFMGALAGAVRQLPSGQVPMPLRLAAAAVPQLPGCGTGASLAVRLYHCCLSSLQVDLTTASAAAKEAAALVAALAPLLAPLLREAAAGAGAPGGGSDSGKKERKKQLAAQAGEGLLPDLLLLYRDGLALHARCAALHPEVPPLPGQQAQPPTAEAAAAGSGGDGAGYFAPLQHHAGDAQTLPELPELLEQAAGSGSLRRQLLSAAAQRLQVLHQRHQFLARTCPITLLPGPGAEPEGEGEQQAQQAQRQQAEQAHVQEQAQAHAAEELHQLATAVVAAACEDAATPAAGGSGAWEVAARVLPLLQEWAPPAQLQTLLQACLRLAAGGGGDRRAALCRRLFLDGEFAEQCQLAALLPAAAAAELGAALRVALGEAAAAGVDGGSAKKKSKKGAAEGAAAGTQVGALLQQLERLAKGKGTKSSAWAAAVEAACDSIAALAAGLGSDGGSGTKKRKHHPHGDAAAATAGDLAAVQRQAELLAQLPLSSLQSEAATAMAALAVGSLLCCWEGSLACLQAACDTKQLVRSALRTSTACLQLLARLAGGSSGRSLCSKRQELPAVLRAALMAAHGAAGLWSDASVLAQVSLAAEHSSSVMQAAFAAHLAALNGSGLQQMAQQLGQQLEQQQGPQQWAAAVLAQACLAASYAAVQAGSSSSDRAASAILCGTAALEGQQEQQQAAASLIGGTVAALEAAVAAALPGALSAAAAEGSGEQQALLAASLYRSAALVLRLRCSDHPAADALEQQAGGGSGKASSVSTMAAGLQACAALLSPPGAGGTAAAAVLAPAALDYLAACCVVTGHMRPAASNRHYSSLLALLLRLLAQEPVATAIPPSRQTIPFAAAFPAAAAAVAAQASGAGGAARRPLLLGALRELVAGSSSQHLLLPLRFVEAALPSAAAGSGRRSSALALPLCELTLVLLEASGGNRQQRLLGQHCERIAALLSGFVSTTAHARGRAALKQQQLQQQQVPSLQQLAAAILAAGEGGSLETPAAAEASALLPEPAAAAEVAALCTALRALESLAARPKLFPLPAAAICSTLSCIAVVWTAYAEAAPGEQLEPGAAALPGFRFLLSTASGAGLFGGSCHLLMAMLRHRQQELRRCLPLVLQTLRSLLRFLVAADLSARLQEQLGSVAAGAAAGGQQQQQERRLRVKCTELLAAVLSQLTELKDAGIGRYSPHLLADYLILAAAPPSAKSKALLHYSSPFRGAAGAGTAAAAGAVGDPAGGATAAAAAEEDVLAGEPLCPGVASALRQGAYALYGTCSAAEVQFLYASLGGAAAEEPRAGGRGSAASWRAALASLKADYEQGYKYTGKV